MNRLVTYKNDIHIGFLCVQVFGIAVIGNVQCQWVKEKFNVFKFSPSKMLPTTFPSITKPGIEPAFLDSKSNICSWSNITLQVEVRLPILCLYLSIDRLNIKYLLGNVFKFVHIVFTNQVSGTIELSQEPLLSPYSIDYQFKKIYNRPYVAFKTLNQPFTVTNITLVQIYVRRSVARKKLWPDFLYSFNNLSCTCHGIARAERHRVIYSRLVSTCNEIFKLLPIQIIYGSSQQLQ